MSRFVAPVIVFGLLGAIVAIELYTLAIVVCGVILSVVVLRTGVDILSVVMAGFGVIIAGLGLTLAVICPYLCISGWKPIGRGDTAVTPSEG